MPPRQNAICWEKSGNTCLLTSCPSPYPYHSRLATYNSAGLAAFEDGVLYRCYRQMRNSEFSEGCMEIHDENRSGRPSVSDRVVEKVETILLEDRRITIQELALLIPEISSETFHKILTDKLGDHKVCARWVCLQKTIGLAAEFYNMGIEKLEHRLQKCLDINGDYVEK
ncbi:hypothetical protein J6590_088641 [Homalodisca vitripennis]|nr:hypothetical protein J6590_088641 [Homalodisca vitripennis]